MATDETVAGIAVGFTLGFGLLTVWEAIKQTRRSKDPRRSAYIFMIWGEIIANIGLLILGYLFFEGVLLPSIPLFFFILFFWVFEIQLLMQIIINRIAIISETQTTIRKLKIGTALIISAINIAVFCVFIPSHLVPVVNETYVVINRYWDRTSKVLICLVDGSLNYYFLRVVKLRLVDQYGLMKYEPLVKFNTRLMLLSVTLDLLLIGLMSLPNQEVFILFHPLVYTSKLNIEMSMASLILRLARSGRADAYHPSSSIHMHSTPHDDRGSVAPGQDPNEREVSSTTSAESRVRASFSDGSSEVQNQFPSGDIQMTRTFQVTVHHHSSTIRADDEVYLTRHPGYPTAFLQDAHSNARSTDIKDS